jgi:hypothetical protein
MLSNIVYRALNFAPPDGDSTEASFHSFWDDNIRWILQSVFIESKTIRDSNMHTSTGLLRPDFGLLLGGNCAFRGEEKAPTYSGRHPKEELIQKLRWTYDPALYILGWCSVRSWSANSLIFIHSGYYAIGSHVTFVAITPLSVVDLVSLDLALALGRLQCMACLIKLCTVIASLGNIIGTRNTPEYVALDRG